MTVRTRPTPTMYPEEKDVITSKLHVEPPNCSLINIPFPKSLFSLLSSTYSYDLKWSLLSSCFEPNCISITCATWTLRSNECRYRSAYSKRLYWMVMIEHFDAATTFHPGKEAPVPIGRKLCRGLRFFRRPRCRQVTLQIRLFPHPVRNDSRMYCNTALTEVHTGIHSVSVAR